MSTRNSRSLLYIFLTIVFCHFWCQYNTLRPHSILWMEGQTSHAASHRRSRSHRAPPHVTSSELSLRIGASFAINDRTRAARQHGAARLSHTA
jgi:hypothetical protein